MCNLSAGELGARTADTAEHCRISTHRRSSIRLDPTRSRTLSLTLACAQDLTTSETSITEESVQLMKHHGSYMQDDRDKRSLGQVRTTSAQCIGVGAPPPVPHE